MSPEVRVLVRAVIAGVLALCASLTASISGSDLTGNEIVIAVISGVVAAATLAAAEFGTPVNPTVGKGADPS